MQRSLRTMDCRTRIGSIRRTTRWSEANSIKELTRKGDLGHTFLDWRLPARRKTEIRSLWLEEFPRYKGARSTGPRKTFGCGYSPRARLPGPLGGYGFRVILAPSTPTFF